MEGQDPELAEAGLGTSWEEGTRKGQNDLVGVRELGRDRIT